MEILWVQRDEEYIDGNDHPQFVINDEKWKIITSSDLKRSFTPFFENDDVVEGGWRVMIPASPPITDHPRQESKNTIQILDEVVAERKGEQHSVNAETLVMDCLWRRSFSSYTPQTLRSKTYSSELWKDPFWEPIS